jgi:hypothetical protein
MREAFIKLNGVGKKKLDIIDEVHQKIYAVRTDGSTNPEWTLITNKFQLLANRGIFLTHKKFGDDDMPGAYSRLNEFIDSKYDLVVVEHFAEYFYQVCGSSRPIRPKESWMMHDFFKMCKEQRIPDVDVDYITELATCLKVVDGNDFDCDKLFEHGRNCYREWWRLNKPNPDGTTLGISYNEESIAMTMLFAQLRKSFKRPLPRYAATWSVSPKNLF